MLIIEKNFILEKIVFQYHTFIIILFLKFLTILELIFIDNFQSLNENSKFVYFFFQILLQFEIFF